MTTLIVLTIAFAAFIGVLHALLARHEEAADRLAEWVFGL